MIRKLEDNDVADCIALMKKSYAQNDSYGVGYNARNEVAWIEFLIKHVTGTVVGDPHFFTICDVQDGEMKGFMIASTYLCPYTARFVMDVKDCIVDKQNNNAIRVTRFFDKLMEHIEENGGLDWRADSVQAFDDSNKYAEFLCKRYRGTKYVSVRGQV